MKVGDVMFAISIQMWVRITEVYPTHVAADWRDGDWSYSGMFDLDDLVALHP